MSLQHTLSSAALFNENRRLCGTRLRIMLAACKTLAISRPTSPSTVTITPRDTRRLELDAIDAMIGASWYADESETRGVFPQGVNKS